MRSAPDELQALLAWAALPQVGEQALLALRRHARETGTTLSELWAAPLEDLTAWVRLDARAAAALRTGAAERWARAGAEAEAIRARGVDVLFPDAPDAPPAVRDLRRPAPFLFAFGAVGLLEEPRVALVNSAEVCQGGLAATDALADALARRDVPLVASTNRPSYQAAATAAKRHAGPAILVLDRGMGEAFPGGLEREPVAAARVWDEALDPDLQLLLCPFAWRERWTARSGPRRDALVFDLADVIVAVDIREDGKMYRWCREAALHGRPVLALDRGRDTGDGTRSLWEAVEGVSRIRWTGREAAAEQILQHLPARPMPGDPERWRSGWRREVGQFLIRAARVLDGGRAAGPVGAFPAAGEMASIASAWSAAAEDAGTGFSWLLADLAWSGEHSPGRLRQLLERVRPGGLLLAAVPAGWLSEERHGRARAEWLERASLRLSVRLPQPVTGGPESTAAVILQRELPPGPAAPVFLPERDRMGRFHLRRYLNEVLAALGSGG